MHLIHVQNSLFTTQSPQLTPQSEFTSHSSASIVVMAEDTSHNQSSQFTVCSLVIICGSHLVVNQYPNLLHIRNMVDVYRLKCLSIDR